ncbi:hypothetical protein MMC26_004861 [Xylographa opegraphella]|nr:hypothetical protein [Xylographa opegraphella]
MSPFSAEAWPGLLRRQRADYEKHLPEGPQKSFASRREFVNALESAADKRNEGNTQLNLNKLRRSYKKIESFANAVGKQSALIKSDDLLALVWDVSFAVITVRSSSLEKTTLVDRITDLDDNIPDLGIYPESLIDFPPLQEPLQAIYTQYIVSFLEMIGIIRRSKRLEKKDFQFFLDTSVNLFEERKKEYIKLGEVVRQTARWVYKDKATPPQFTILVDRPLGRGTYGKVDTVKEVSTGQLYARKRLMAGPGLSQVFSVDRVWNEINIMRRLVHHHITTLAFSTKDDQGFSLYILPVAECNLGNFLKTSKQSGTYTNAQVYMWFGCLIGALDYAHRCGVVHKDIKPENILIDDEGERVLLTDFGLAKEFSDGVSRTTGPLIVGTPKYLAPECQEHGDRTESVDVFALGCVYAEILSFLSGQALESFDETRRGWGGEPFRCCLEDTKRWLNKQKDVRKESNHNRIISQTRYMLSAEEVDRPSAGDVSGNLTGDGLRCAKCSR